MIKVHKRYLFNGIYILVFLGILFSFLTPKFIYASSPSITFIQDNGLAQVTNLFQQFLEGTRNIFRNIIDAGRRGIEAITPGGDIQLEQPIAPSVQQLPPPPVPIAPPATSPQTIIERVIERAPIVREVVREVQRTNEGRLEALEQLVQQLQQGQQSQGAFQTALFQSIALTNKIDNLSSITLNSPTISGTITLSGSPSFTGMNQLGASSASISGTLSAATTTVSGSLAVSGLGATSTISTGANAGFAVGANQLLVQGATGRVGIGTTSPAATLGVQGSLITSGNTTIGGNLVIAGSQTVSGVQLFTGAVNASSTLQVTGAARFYNNLIADGNVGVGTTSPAKKLSVQGDALFSGNLTLANLTATGTLDVTGLATIGNASTTQISSTESAYFATASGNVGIGTSSPWANLSVDQGAGEVGFAVGSSTATNFVVNNNNRVGIGTSSPSAQFAVELINDPDFTNPYVLMGLEGYSLPAFIIQDDGDVGINVAAPAGKFEVGGTIRGTYLTATQDGTGSSPAFNFQNGTGFGMFYDNDNTSLGLAANGQERLTVSFDGKVGIGTTSPAQKLSVQGNALFSGNISSVANITATGTLALTGATGTSTIAHGLAIETSGFVYDYQTNKVGIGTAAPGSKLHVASENTPDAPQGDIIMSRSWTSPTDTRASAIFHYFSSGAGVTKDFMAFGVSGQWNDVEQSYLAPNDIARVKMVIGANGNVGVGTTSPAQTLSVQGNALFSGNLTLTNLTAIGTLNAAGLTTLGNASTTQLSASGALYVGGNATTTNTGAFTTNGAITGNSTLNISGLTTLTNASTTLLSASGALFVNGNATTSANGNFATQGTLAVNGATTLSSTLSAGTTTADNLQQTGFAGDAGYFRTNANNLQNTSTLNPGILWFGDGDTSYGADLGYNSVTGRYRSRIFGGHSGTDIALGIQNEGAGAMSSQSTFVEYLTVRGDTGNVGIGTTTPNTKLQVADASRPQFLLTDTGGGTDAKHVYASSTAGAWAWGTLNDALSTLTERMRLTTGGSLGIGTTSPTQLLSVQGNALFSGGLTLANLTATGTLNVNGLTTLGNASTTQLSASGALYVGGNATTTNTGAFTTNGAITGLSTLTMTGLTTLTNASTTLLSASGAIFVNGNATTSANGNFATQGTLAVNGTGVTTGNLFAVTSASTALFTNGGVYFNFTGAHTGNGVRITDATVAGEAMQIEGASLTSGKALDINVNALTTGTGLSLNSSSNALAAGGKLLGLNYTGNSLVGAIFRVDDEVSDITPFLVDPSGNVGIGTTTPNTKLQVVDASRPQLLLTDTGGGADAKHAYASSTAGAWSWGTLNDALSTFTERMRLTTGGSLGIGTTSPTEQLSVANRLYVGGSGTSTIENNLQVRGTLQVGAGSIYLNDSALNLGANALTSTGSLSGGTLALSGNLAASSTLQVTGAARLFSTLLVDGALTASGPLQASSTLQATGATRLYSTLLVDSALNASSTLQATGDTRLYGTLTVDGATTLSSTLTAGTSTLNNLAVTNISTSTIAGGLAVRISKFIVDNVTGNVGIGTTTPSKLFSVHGDSLFSGDLSLANLTATGTLTQNAFAYTNLTASTEKTDVNLNLARIVQFASGNLATQRAVLVQAPTYSFTASSTLTDASTLLITGAPAGGTFATTTNTYALKIDAGSVRGSGAIAPDNAYGFYVSAPTGATNNYSANFATGNVGIGTTSPSQLLSVHGNALLSGNLTVANLTATGTANITGASTLTGLATMGSGFVSQASSTVVSSLNVGGNLAASSTLQTTGAARLYSTLLVDGALSASSTLQSTGNARLYGTLTVDGATTLSSTLNTGTTTMNNLAVTNLATSTVAGGLAVQTNKFVVDNATGNVGVGTTTPSRSFAVHGNALFSGDITIANLTATGTLNVTGLTTLGNASTTQISSTNAAYFATSAGNVGIGTTSPYTKLSIVATEVVAGTPVFVLDTSARTDAEGGPIINFSHGGQPVSFIKTTSGAGNIAPYLAFGVSLNATAPTERMRIDENGNVGIGTTSPPQLLSVQGNALFSGDLTLANLTATGTLNVTGLTTLSNASTTQVSASGVLYTPLTTAGSITFIGSADGRLAQDNANLFWDDTNNRLGLGTTTPNWNLQVAGTRPFFTLSDDTASADLKHWTMSSQGGNFYIATSSDALATSTVPALTILSNGNVGIGTSSPTARLSIEGTCVDTGAGCADYAELYPSSESVEPGDVLSIDTNNPGNVKRAKTGDNLIGIVSTNPAIVIEGSSLQFMGGIQYKSDPTKPAVALAGRVPVKVNLEGGSIQAGDPITISSRVGIGKRATESGKIIGYALASYQEADEQRSRETGQQGSVLLFVSNSYWQAPSNTDSLLAQVVDMVRGWLESMQVFVENGIVRVKKLVTNTLTADELELRDKATGEVYCISIVNGEFEKAKGECVSVTDSQSFDEAQGGQQTTDDNETGEQSNQDVSSELSGPSQAPPPPSGLTTPQGDEEAGNDELSSGLEIDELSGTESDSESDSDGQSASADESSLE